jgi:hypothetical protein
VNHAGPERVAILLLATRSVGSAGNFDGDFSGDGLADVIVGASLADPNRNSSGAAYVVYGLLPDTACSAVLPISP